MAHMAHVPSGAQDEAHSLMYELRTRLAAGVESDYMGDETVIESVAPRKDPQQQQQQQQKQASGGQHGGRFVAMPAAFDPGSIAAAAAARAARVASGETKMKQPKRFQRRSSKSSAPKPEDQTGTSPSSSSPLVPEDLARTVSTAKDPPPVAPLDDVETNVHTQAETRPLPPTAAPAPRAASSSRFQAMSKATPTFAAVEVAAAAAKREAADVSPSTPGLLTMREAEEEEEEVLPPPPPPPPAPGSLLLEAICQCLAPPPQPPPPPPPPEGQSLLAEEAPPSQASQPQLDGPLQTPQEPSNRPTAASNERATTERAAPRQLPIAQRLEQPQKERDKLHTQGDE